MGQNSWPAKEKIWNKPNVEKYGCNGCIIFASEKEGRKSRI